MNQELQNVGAHIRHFAEGALAHACWHANYFSHENDFWNELSVIQAAHAMELFIKARIAEEHPLLIFNRLPRPTGSAEEQLCLQDLVESGQTYAYNELPDRLWASTGIRLPEIKKYSEFGKLRNIIQHFTIPNDIDCGKKSIEFIYGVIDPFINECWGYFAIDYNEDHEPYEYLVSGLISRGVTFLVSPDAKEFVMKATDWPGDEYKTLMLERAANA